MIGARYTPESKRAQQVCVGVDAAIANAVYHATGIRVRDLPITPDKLLTQL